MKEQKKSHKTQYCMKSRIGPLYLVAADTALLGVYWRKQEQLPVVKKFEGVRGDILRLAEKEISEYLAGERKVFTVPLAVEQGTSFQREVWAQLKKIPYGQTRSYQEIAEKIRKPRACRAVGTANGRNPLSIVVPCHRVINLSGSLGGFAGGLQIKRLLLELEGQFR